MTSMHIFLDGSHHLLCVADMSVFFERYSRLADLMVDLARFKPDEAIFFTDSEVSQSLVDFAGTLGAETAVVQVAPDDQQLFLSSLIKSDHYRTFIELDLSALPMPNAFYHLALWYLHNRTEIESEAEVHLTFSHFMSRVKVFPLQLTPTVASELGVLTVVQHPGQIKESNRDKFGMSFCTIFGQFCANPIGRKVVRDILEYPTTSLAAIGKRLDDLSVLVHSEFNLVNQFEQLAKKYLSFGKMMSKMIDERFDLDDFYHFYANLGILKQLFEVVSRLFSHDFINRRLADFLDLIEEIEHVVDLKIDVVTRTGILRGVSAEYDELEACYGSLNEFLGVIEDDLRKKLPLKNIELRILSFPEIGYLISLSMEDPELASGGLGDQENPAHAPGGVYRPALNQLIGDLLGTEFEFVFRKDQIFFYRSSHTKELDEKIGDLRAQFWKTQRLLYLTIQTELLSYRPFFEFCDQKIAWVVGMVGISKATAFYDLKKPILSNGADFRALVAEDAWNLFLKLTSPVCISFDFCCSDQILIEQLGDFDGNGLLSPGKTNRLNLISGPNSSGKTQACKTLASLVYLAQCGLWVPAANFVSQIFEKLFIFGSEPSSGSHLLSSVQQSVQSFMRLLPDIDDKTFVIFDEFLRNASNENYEAFCLAVFEYFGSPRDDDWTRATPPLLFMNTHHLRMLGSGLVEEGPWVSLLRMGCSVIVEGARFNTFSDCGEILRALKEALESGSDLGNTQVVNYYCFERGVVESSFGYFLLTRPELRNPAFLQAFLSSLAPPAAPLPTDSQKIFWKKQAQFLLQFVDGFF